MNGTPLTIGASSVAAPQLDGDATTAVEEALETLRLLRNGERYNNADRLTALSSIALAAQALLPDAIADAVEQGFTWDQIAHCAGTSTSAARRRYAQGPTQTQPRGTEPETTTDHLSAVSQPTTTISPRATPARRPPPRPPGHDTQPRDA
jgi:hypothetical protein